MQTCGKTCVISRSREWISKRFCAKQAYLPISFSGLFDVVERKQKPYPVSLGVTPSHLGLSGLDLPRASSTGRPVHRSGCAVSCLWPPAESLPLRLHTSHHKLTHGTLLLAARASRSPASLPLPGSRAHSNHAIPSDEGMSREKSVNKGSRACSPNPERASYLGNGSVQDGIVYYILPHVPGNRHFAKRLHVCSYTHTHSRMCVYTHHLYVCISVRTW